MALRLLYRCNCLADVSKSGSCPTKSHQHPRHPGFNTALQDGILTTQMTNWIWGRFYPRTIEMLFSCLNSEIIYHYHYPHWVVFYPLVNLKNWITTSHTLHEQRGWGANGWNTILLFHFVFYPKRLRKRSRVQTGGKNLSNNFEQCIPSKKYYQCLFFFFL